MADDGKNGTPKSTVLTVAPRNSATPKPKPQIGLEIGVSRVLPFGAWFIDSRTSTQGTDVGNDPAAVPITKLVEMRRHDGQARALMRLLTLPIRAAMADAEWIEPDGGAEQETQFANDMFDLPQSMGGMKVGKQRLLRQTLLALCDGYAVFEEVRTVPNSGPLQGKITLEKLAYRDAKTIRFVVDKKGEFDGVRQIADLLGRAIDVRIPKDKVIYYAANEEENPMYGVSYFESAFYHYEIKKKLYYIAHIASQFAAVPGRVAKMPPNADKTERGQVLDAIANFAFNTSMMLPSGWELDFTTATSSFDFLALIDHHNTMMAASVLAKFLQQEDRQVLIDNSKADASADMFVLAIESIMDEIAELWSLTLMPKYIDWNFGTQKYPLFRFGQLTDTAKDAIKDLFGILAISGTLNCTPEFMRQLEEKLTTRLGLDIDYDEIAKAEEEQAKQKAAADDAQQADPNAPNPPPPGAPPVKPGAAPPLAVVPPGGKPGFPPKPGQPGAVVATGVVPQTSKGVVVPKGKGGVAMAATGLDLPVEEVAREVLRLTREEE